MLVDPVPNYQESDGYKQWILENEGDLQGAEKMACLFERQKFFQAYSAHWQDTLGMYGEIERINWGAAPSIFWGQPWDPKEFKNGHKPKWTYPFEAGKDDGSQSSIHSDGSEYPLEVQQLFENLLGK